MQSPWGPPAAACLMRRLCPCGLRKKPAQRLIDGRLGLRGRLAIQTLDRPGEAPREPWQRDRGKSMLCQLGGGIVDLVRTLAGMATCVRTSMSMKVRSGIFSRRSEMAPMISQPRAYRGLHWQPTVSGRRGRSGIAQVQFATAGVQGLGVAAADFAEANHRNLQGGSFQRVGPPASNPRSHRHPPERRASSARSLWRRQAPQKRCTAVAARIVHNFRDRQKAGDATSRASQPAVTASERPPIAPVSNRAGPEGVGSWGLIR